MATTRGFPVQLLLAGAPVLVVGGGPIASRKAAALVAAGAEVTVVAPAMCGEVARLPVRLERRTYRRGEAGGYRLVITATGDPAVDGAVAEDAGAANVFVNSADDPERCTFTLPAIARRGPITVTVATDGHSPLLASALRDVAATLVDDDVVRLAEALASTRNLMRAAGESTEAVDWSLLLGGDLAATLRDGRAGHVADELGARLAAAGSLA